MGRSTGGRASHLPDWVNFALVLGRVLVQGVLEPRHMRQMWRGPITSMPRPSAGYWVTALSLATQAWPPSSKAERLGPAGTRRGSRRRPDRRGLEPAAGARHSRIHP